VFKEQRLTLIKIVNSLSASLTVDIYICLLMHALVGDDDKIVVNDDDVASVRGEKIYHEGVFTKLKKVIGLGKPEEDDDVEAQNRHHDDFKWERRASFPIAQHYNPERSLIYEEVKTSRPSNLTVAVEQVSMFLTGDRTLITFFQVFL
jgi:hypothetical protein